MESKGFLVTDDILASRGQRFCHYIVDWIVVYSLILAFAFFVGLFAALTDNVGLSNWLENVGDLEGYVVLFSITILYFGFMETLLSRSIGKYITNTIVVMEDGSKPAVGVIIKRSFCRLIPFDPLSFLNSNSRGWHDSISDTYVVKKAAFDRSRDLFYSLDEIGIAEESEVSKQDVSSS